MSVFSVERHGFITLHELASSIALDLRNNGFYSVLDKIAGPMTDAQATGIVTAASNPVAKVTRPSPTYGFSISSFTIVEPGTKYDPENPPTVEISAPSVTLNNFMQDAGYLPIGGNASYSDWNDPDVLGNVNVTLYTSEANNMIRRATGTSVVGSDGTITGITITDPGYGYSQTETITVKFGEHATSINLLLESTELVDPLGLKLGQDGQPLSANQQTGQQPWRINFDLRGSATSPTSTGGSLGVYLGTSATLRDNGIIGYVVDSTNTTTPSRVEPAGNVGAKWTSGGKPNTGSMDQCFINRLGRVDPAIAAAYPMSYRLTVTDRGFFLGVWEANAEELGNGFNWLLVQRSVDRLTGVTRGSTQETASGRCPVFCLNAVNNKYYKFVVRESDLIMPSERKLANLNVEDSSAVINTLNQQSLTEGGEYVITFISNLNSARYKYADELDIIGTVSADVVGAGTSLDVTVYGETSPRTYYALYPNGAFGTGMRLMLLVANPNET